MRKMIFGDGLMGSIVASNLNCEHFIFTYSRKRAFQTVRSDLCTHIYGRKYAGGLSKYYHGLTPAKLIIQNAHEEFFQKIQYAESVKTQNITFDMIVNDYFFLPDKVVRPNFFPVNQNHSSAYTQWDLKIKDSDTAYLCLSCIGNIQFLQKYNLVPDVFYCDDDVVISHGTVDSLKQFEYKPLRFENYNGLFFPAYRFDDMTIYFRPVFFKDTEVNFTNIFNNFANVSQVSEKILRMVFARFGIITARPIAFEIITQSKVKNLYSCRKNSDISVNSVRLKTHLMRTEEKIKGFTYLNKLNYIKFPNPRLLSGIHLSYDRNTLERVPQNINVLDTSLSQNNGYHNTTEAAFNVYNLTK